VPVTQGFVSRRSIKGEGHIHTDKWHRCIEHVKEQGGDYEPHAVCTASIGYSGSINPEHRTRGPHASTKHRKKKQDVTLTAVFKYNPNHDEGTGQFTSGGSGGAGTTESTSTPEQQQSFQFKKKTSKPTAESRSRDLARYHELSKEWATVNTALQEDLDHPESAATTAKLQRMNEIVKEMHSLDADPGGPEGRKLPGGPRDVVIVGAGPGGLSAAIAAGAEGLDTLLVEAGPEVGGQAKFSGRIENYPGYPVGAKGKRIANDMFIQASRLRTETQFNTRVVGIEHDPDTDMKTVVLSDGSRIEARAVVIAGGLAAVKGRFHGADAPSVHVMNGEKLAEDGKGEQVVVTGGSNSAAQAALTAATKAKHVVLVSRSPLEKGMSDYVMRQILAHPNITVIEGDTIAHYETDAEGRGKAVTLASGVKLPARAVGVFIGSNPDTNWLPSAIQRRNNKVVVDDDLQTHMPGVFAVGDIRWAGEVQPQNTAKENKVGTNGRIAAAVGDGTVSIKNVFPFLDAMDEKHRRRTQVTKMETFRRRPGSQALKAAELDRVNTLYDDVLQLDLENPWFGQSIEPSQALDDFTVLKYNKNHDTSTGRFTSGDSGGGTTPKDTSGATTYRAGKKLTPAQQEMQAELARQASKPVHKVQTAEEAVALVLKGENVEIQDHQHVHTVLKKLGEIALDAQKKGEQAPSFDPCTITVKGVSLFCTEKLKTEEFPEGIPRIEMPQFKSKNPVPGSEADKLPRDKKGEVDAKQIFLDHLAAAGVKSHDGMMLARKLKASQAEMEGTKVAGMMNNPDFDPKKERILVSSDGYVIDGHHTWAAAVGRDAADGNLDNDQEMNVKIIDMPMAQVYHASVAWTKKFGMPAAGVGGKSTPTPSPRKSWQKRFQERQAGVLRMRRAAGGVIGDKQRARDFRMARGREQQRLIRMIRARKD
jgi:thioredoxin reductase